MLLLAGSGGYLLWRVNQQQTVSPTDSDATGGAGACCNSAGCVAGWKCDTSKPCSACEYVTIGTGSGAECGTIGSTTVKCRKGFSCSDPGTHKCCPTSSLGTCVKETSETGPTEGTCASKVNSCEWPKTIMSDKNCACEVCDGSNGCSGNPPSTCSSLGSCPSGYTSCGDSTSHSDSVDCKAYSSISCVVYHKDCNNPSSIYRYCTPQTTTNTCDSGSWVTKPSGTYAYCDAITYSANAMDSDGIKESSIVVKLNNVNRTTFSTSTSGTSTTISENLSTSTSCLDPGNYTLDLSWADSKGATSSNCALTTTFTVEAKQTNPDWKITKTVVGKCIDENTENPTSQLDYVITVKNTGDGTGALSKITDVLDTKVKQSYISNISNGGTYTNGSISWTSDLEYTSGQSKTFTYTVTVSKDDFGTYKNTVTAYPVEGDSTSAQATITADCTTPPQTGIFDSTIVRIIAGFLLIIIGIVLNMTYDFWRKVVVSMKEVKENRRMKNFEKKVVKR